LTRSLRVLAPVLSRRSFLQGLGLAALGAGCGAPSNILNFYNWSLFIGPDTLAGFEKATGVRVNYEEFSSADVLFAKLKIGVTGYDLVVSPDYMVVRLRRHRLLQRLPVYTQRSQLYAHLQNPPWDPELGYSMPYLWGTTGVAYRKDLVPGQAPDSWNLLWDTHLGRRITMLDEKRDTIGATLIHLGYSGNSTNPVELAAAKSCLVAQKPFVRRYTSDYVDDLIRGETTVALAWSGDARQAMVANPNVGYYIPREGSFYFVDNLCVPTTAPHPREAFQFIDYYLQPKVVAGVTNATGYANPMRTAEPLVSLDLRDDHVTYPDAHTMNRLQFQRDLGPQERVWDALWDEVKR
jgi:spermidine/putrescine-binding protein